MKSRSIAVGAAFVLIVGLFSVGWAHRAREEADSIGDLLGRSPATTVNAASLATVNAPARPAPISAQDFVDARQQKLRALLRDGAPPEFLAASVDAMVDYDKLAQAALGQPCPRSGLACTNHWEELTTEQQTEVTSLLRALVARNVARHLEKTLAYAITYGRTKDLGGGLSSVRTEAKKADEAILVDFVVARSGDEHRVVDVVTEGSSMVKNYYDQFHRMLTTPDQGYAFMVMRLRAKLAR